MEAQDLSDRARLGTAVFVNHHRRHARLQANEIIELANGRFGEIGNALIIHAHGVPQAHYGSSTSKLNGDQRDLLSSWSPRLLQSLRAAIPYYSLYDGGATSRHRQ